MINRNDLYRKISLLKKVSELSGDGHDEAESIANLMIDCREALIEIDDLLQRFSAKSDLTEEDIENLIVECGDQLRHIMYHVGDCRYYSYWFPG